MTSLTPLAQHYLDRFDEALKSLPGAGDRHVASLRRQGLESFAALDFPTKRIEEWRFTNLAALTKAVANETETVPATTQTKGSFSSPHEMVFINGRFSAEESRLDALPDGITILPVSQSLGQGSVLNFDETETRSLIGLNTAFMQDGVSLHVDDGVILDEVLTLIFRNNPSAENGRHIRNLITLGEGASVTLLERHEGTGRYFTNPVTRISLDRNARLQHYKLQQDSKAAFHLALVDCEIASGACYDNFCLSIGGQISRNEMKTTILGEEAESHLNGAYLMRGHQHCDTTTLTEHTVPLNNSSQIYKGVLDDDAHGVFQGKIHIFPDAQQVAGDQLSKALLLSERAAVDCKPELEIYADDVKCSHGATSGELDEDALFYLQSRGIPFEQARKILIEAFLADVLDTVKQDDIRAFFETLSTAWLSGTRADEK